MSTNKNLIYQYLAEAKKEFLSKSHPVIKTHGHNSLWIPSEDIPHYAKEAIEFATHSLVTRTMSYEILYGVDEEYFSIITKEIASGGYGQVKYIVGYLWLNHQSQETFWKRELSAVKCIPISKSCPMSGIEKEWDFLSLYSEKAKENHLTSPEVKPLLYSYSGNGTLFAFIRMKYTGIDLLTWLDKNNPLEIPFTLAIKILELIQFLHKNGIVHRDLKLENITIDHKGHLCAIDFGFSGHVSTDEKVNAATGTPVYKNPHHMAYLYLHNKDLPLSTTEDLGSVLFLLQEIMDITFNPFWYELNLPVYKEKMVLQPYTVHKKIPKNISMHWIMETLLLLYNITENYIPLDEMIHQLTIIKENHTPPKKKTFINSISSLIMQPKREFISELREALLKTQGRIAFTKVILSFLDHLRSLQLKPEKAYEIVKRMDIMTGFLISTDMFWLFPSYSGYLSYRHIRAHILAEKYLLQPSQQNLQELFRYPILKNVYLQEKILEISSPHKQTIQFLVNLEEILNQDSVDNYDEVKKLFIHIKKIISTPHITLASVYNRLSMLENLFHNYMTMHPHGSFLQNEKISTLGDYQEELQSQREMNAILYSIFRYIISLLMRRVELFRENSFIIIDAKTIKDVGESKTLSEIENDIKNCNTDNIKTLTKKQNAKIKHNITNSKSFSEEERDGMWNSIHDLLTQINEIHEKENPSLEEDASASPRPSSSSYSSSELHKKHGFKTHDKGKGKASAEPEENVASTVNWHCSNGHSNS